MIIKSMGRHNASFAQALIYVSRGVSDPDHVIRRNLYGESLLAAIADFEDNARHLKARKNGLYLYHDIVSITRSPGMPIEAQKAALRDIAWDYVRVRAPDCLVYGCIHDDKANNLHCHLVISANALGSSKRHRLSRQEFREIVVSLEARVLARYPELQQTLAIGKRAERKLSRAGGELTRRTGTAPKRQSVEDRARAVFTTATSKDECLSRLKASGIELYQRGATLGLVDTVSGKKHRLKTLGLMPDFLSMSARIESTETRKAQAAVQKKIAEAQGRQSSMPNAAQSAKTMTPAPIPPKEADVNLIDIALQGVAALVDAASITPKTIDPVDDEDAEKQNQALAPKPVPLPAAPVLSERDRIAAERIAELEGLSKGDGQERTLKR